MDDLYVAPRALVDVTPPFAHHTAFSCPDNVSCLVVVNRWENPAAQIEWEDRPGVIPLPIWDHGKPAPPALVAAFAAHGVRSSHTAAEALHLVRRRPGFGAARH